MDNTKPDLTFIKSLVQFLDATEGNWDEVTTPVPDGMLVYANDTGSVKLGDGKTLYINLATLFKLSDLLAIIQAVKTSGVLPGSQSNQASGTPQILGCATAVESDGQTIPLDSSWNVDNQAALTVIANGTFIPPTAFTMSSPSSIYLTFSLEPNTSVYVRWDCVVSANGTAVSVPAVTQVEASATPFNPANTPLYGGGGSSTGSGTTPSGGGTSGSGTSGSGTTSKGYTIVTGATPDIWTDDGSETAVSNQAATLQIYQGIDPSYWTTTSTSPSTPSAIFQSPGPSYWSKPVPNYTTFGSIGASAWGQNGSGVNPATSQIVQGLPATAFMAGGPGVTAAEVELVSLPATTWQ